METTTQKTVTTATKTTNLSRGVAVSEDLLQRVRLLTKKKLGGGNLAWSRRESLLDLVERYEVACWLSAGPDPKRAEHWAEEARVAERRLKASLDKLDAGPPKAEQKR